MYASFVSRLEEASESEEEFDDASQDDNEVVRYERTSRHQSRRDELIRRVQAAHAHSAAAHARGGDSEPSHSDEQQDQRAPAAAAPTTTAQQDTLDTYLPRHAARARELEAASDSLVDDASDKGSTGSIAGNRSGRRAAAVQDEAACAATGHDPSAVRGRNKRKRLQSRSLAGLGGGRGRQSTGLDLIGAFRGGAGSLPDPQASVRHPAPSSHQIRSHSLRAAQQSAHSRGRGGGLDLVGAFRSSAAQSTQSPQPELSSQRVYKKARPGAKAPKATPSKCHSLRRADPASADRGCLWKAPPSFLGGPVRNLDSQSSGSRAFAHLQHPAEATQSRLGDKKGLKGERERVIADMKSGVFAADRLAVKLRFRMLDGRVLLAITISHLSAYQHACSMTCFARACRQIGRVTYSVHAAKSLRLSRLHRTTHSVPNLLPRRSVMHWSTYVCTFRFPPQPHTS